jgi:hypothetical protein
MTILTISSEHLKTRPDPDALLLIGDWLRGD